MKRTLVAFIAVFLVMLWRVPAAEAVTFSGSSGGLSASATFTLSNGGTTLTILLTNTDAATGAGFPMDPASVLSGLFWNFNGITAPTLTTVSASVYGANSSIIQTSNCDVQSCAGQTNVGGEWSYAKGGLGSLSGTTQGIASAGYLNNNTSNGNFNGPNYETPAALNGIEFGIVPDGWVPMSGNGGLDNNALIEGTVKFVLNSSVVLNESMINKVYFTYGTSAENIVKATNGTTTTTTSGQQVPEPAALSLLGMGLILAGARLRRKRK